MKKIKCTVKNRRKGIIVLAKSKKKIENNSNNIKFYNTDKSDQFLTEEICSETLTKNYMPYAMSVIISRAIPEIDGLKPSHRKVLYTMYKMGLLNGNKTKSANIVGQTMKLNPHGDSSIYETMCRLTQNQESLLTPYVEGKGNFGKVFSRDMAEAASRYTEAKLAPISEELFKDINKNTVQFVPNYDNTTTEPSLLPVSFPTILANPTLGIAVGMASNICSYNLKELCETTIGLIKDKNHDILSTLPAPDFTTGGQILFDKEEMIKIIETGKGKVKVRAKYEYDKKQNVIEIREIPSTTTIEAIIEKITDLVKTGKIKEINDIRDETDLSGLKIAIDLKRGQDPDKFMQKMFKLTPCEDTFSCNFNVLIKGYPKVLGVRDILNEWIEFRVDCVKNRTLYDLNNKKEKLHLLEGLEKILLNIDKAIKIIKETPNDDEVIPNLMSKFKIDEVQAEYVAEIKLRHLNKDYILKRIAEIETLKKDIETLEKIVGSNARIKTIIAKELENVIKKYGKSRKTEIVYEAVEEFEIEENKIDGYPVHLFVTKEGYIKKITPLSLRMSGEQKLKENDSIEMTVETTNDANLLFFTDKAQCYKAVCNDLPDTKASVLGSFIPAEFEFDQGENYVACIHAGKDMKGFILFVFESGKIAKIPMSSYSTKTNRKKLVNAYSEKEKLWGIYSFEEDTEIYIKSTDNRMIVFNTNQISEKTTKNSSGVAVMKLKSKQSIKEIGKVENLEIAKIDRYRLNIPALGAIVR